MKRLLFSITPRPIPLLKPLELQVSFNGGAVRKVEVDFTGVNMAMGYNRWQLARSGDNRFSAQATLPVCSSGEMVWEATVLVDTGDSVLAIPFRFVSAH